MCKIFKVSRSCYYAYKPKEVDEVLNNLIKDIFEISLKTYGTRRIQEALKQKYGLIISRKKIAKVMGYCGLRVITNKRFRVQTTDSKHNFGISPNLLNQEFEIEDINSVYVGDITYIKTKEGFVYLASVIDLYSRKVVGWSIADNMKTQLVNNALLMAIKRRKPPMGLIYHTDRGSQYASDAHRQLLQKYSIKQSMSGKGNCYDNAVAESFFHTLKTEFVNHIKFQTKEEAYRKIFWYIEVFYNRQRLHSYCNYLSPNDYEEKYLCSLVNVA